MFGRILCEARGKLNDKSLVIDCIDSNKSILLDLKEVKASYILFENQCIAAKGDHSHNGTVFDIQELFIN